MKRVVFESNLINALAAADSHIVHCYNDVSRRWEFHTRSGIVRIPIVKVRFVESHGTSVDIMLTNAQRVRIIQNSVYVYL